MFGLFINLHEMMMRYLKVISIVVAALVGMSAIIFGVYDRAVLPGKIEVPIESKDVGSSASVVVGGSADGSTIINGDQNVVSLVSGPGFASLSDIQWISGIWDWEYEYPHPRWPMVVKMKGTTEYFDNGSYTAKGLMRVVSGEKVNSAEFQYQLYGTGVWQLHGANLTERLEHVKVLTPRVVVDGRRVDHLSPEIKVPNVKDAFPEGMSTAVEILERSQNRMLIKMKNLTGDPLLIRSSRQKAAFLFDPT